MSVSRKLAVGGLLLFCSLGLAADEEVPDVEFLEYLGLWEESDEEWLIFADADEAKEEEKRSDPVPQGEESTEKEDES